MTNFTDLGLAAPILKALETQGYVTPTPIQAQAIPAVMSGRDLLGIAQTGTGKTAAFSLPIINRLARNTVPRQPKTCRTLILSPTRELATQIADNVRAYSVGSALTVTTVFGGVSHRPQTQALARGVDILVATPGRLLDHMTERNISFAATEVFVLDEADQMLDLGFMPAIRRIVGQLPKERQNLFFSATMPPDIGKLAADLLKDPVRVAVTPVASTVERVNQRVILIETHKKKALLAELFANPEMSRALVFTRTKRGADRVARHLEAAGVGVAAIHGNKSQGQREKALAAFRNARIRALVATDIAARGIDVDDVTHVVNYELPDVPESYVHRIGRTARAGRSGMAISFCDAEERGQLRDIERLTRQTISAEDRRNDATLVLEKPQVKRTSSAATESQDEGTRSSADRHGPRREHRQGRGGQGRPGRDADRRQSGNEGGQRGRDSQPWRNHSEDRRGQSRDGEPRSPHEMRTGERNAENRERHQGDRRLHDRDRNATSARPQQRSGDERRERDREGQGRGNRPQGPRPDGSNFRDRQPREGNPDGRREGHRPQNGGPRPERRTSNGDRSDGDRGADRHDLNKVAFLKPHQRKGDRGSWRGGDQRRDGQRPAHKAAPKVNAR